MRKLFKNSIFGVLLMMSCVCMGQSFMLEHTNGNPLPTNGSHKTIPSGTNFHMVFNFSGFQNFNVVLNNVDVVTLGGFNEWIQNGNILTFNNSQPINNVRGITLVLRIPNDVTYDGQISSIVVNSITQTIQAQVPNFAPAIDVTKHFPPTNDFGTQLVTYKVEASNGPDNGASPSIAGSYNARFPRFEISKPLDGELAAGQLGNGFILSGYTLSLGSPTKYYLTRNSGDVEINHGNKVVFYIKFNYECVVGENNGNAQIVQALIKVHDNSASTTATTDVSDQISNNLNCNTAPQTPEPEFTIAHTGGSNQNCRPHCKSNFHLEINATGLNSTGVKYITAAVPPQFELIAPPTLGTGITVQFLNNSNGSVAYSLATKLLFTLQASVTACSITYNVKWRASNVSAVNPIVANLYSSWPQGTVLRTSSTLVDASSCSTGSILTLAKGRSSSELVYPNEEFYYTMRVQNLHYSANTYITSVQDALPQELIYLGEPSYSYATTETTTTPIAISGSSITNINSTSTIVSVVAPSGPDNLLSINFSGNGLYIPADCSPGINIFLLLKFKVKVKEGVFNTNAIHNFFKTYYTVNSQPYNQSSAIVTANVGQLESVGSEMWVKCIASDTWIQPGSPNNPTFLNVKEDDELTFRMRVKNYGTINSFVYNFLNLKPSGTDFHVAPIDGLITDRQSDFPIDYKCDAVFVHTNSSSTTPYQIEFSGSPPAISRGNNLQPPHGSSPFIDFTNIACVSPSSNWLRVIYDTPFLLQPGEFIDIYYTGIVGSGSANSEAYNSFSVKSAKTFSGNIYNSNNSNTIAIKYDLEGSCVPYDCIDCTSFELTPEKEYIISGWVKEEDPANPTAQFTNYASSNIGVVFKDIEEAPIGYEIKFYTTGAVIDGWQRIIGQFKVHADTEFLELNLNNDHGTNYAYFDDIRILPTAANMKSFVYDQKTQKLMAELDENNYATYYEYDKEGGLIRVKKETERGVFTIQESRSGNKKTNNDD